MKKPTWTWLLFGFALTSLLGTLLHFMYEWLGEAEWIAPFSGVNESTWEHMKLLFWPMVLFAVVESFFFRDYRGLWYVNLCGILLGLSLIPIIFYTYNGVIGKSPDWVNIAIFFVSAACAFILEARLIKSKREPRLSPWASVGVLCALGIMFVAFTFFTPELGVFLDPVTGKYGI